MVLHQSRKSGRLPKGGRALFRPSGRNGAPKRGLLPCGVAIADARKPARKDARKRACGRVSVPRYRPVVSEAHRGGGAGEQTPH